MSDETPPRTENPDADARKARQLEMLAELAELGLDLARAVATHLKTRIEEATESGWSGNLPHDPGAGFSKLAQTVRRCIALETHLREGAAVFPPSGLFAAPPRRPLDLHPPPLSNPSEPADRAPRATLAGDAEAPESLGRDLGRLLDDPERLIEQPVGPTSVIIEELCRDLDLDPKSVRWDGTRWRLRPEPKPGAEADPPPFPPIPSAPINGARLE